MTLIEREELDRLRAKQIRDYSPVLAELVAIKTEMERVLRGGNLAPDDRVKVLNLLHSRFDSIYRQLKYNGTAPLADGAQPLAPALAAAAPVLPAPILAPIPLEPAVDEVMHEGPVPELVAPLEEPAAEEVAAAPRQFRTIATQSEAALAWPSRAELSIPGNMEKKFSRLTEMLSRYPHLINRNEQNELVLSGKPVPGSNFNDLMTSLFSRLKSNLNLEGEQEFIEHLRQAQVHADDVSTKESKRLLEKEEEDEFADVPSSPKQSGTGRKKRPHSTPKLPPSKPIASPKKLGPPPGKRPRILRLYH